MPTMWKKFCDIVRVFSRAREGNVAVIFGLAAIPVIGFVGAAVDYSRANALKTAMQAALDSTALMLSHQAVSIPSDQLKPTAKKYFLAQFQKPGAINVDITNAIYSTDGGTHVEVDAVADVPTEFVRVLGIDKVPIGATSTVRWGSNRLRVALVLDNTGSMNDAGKLNALKTATKSLLSQLKSATTTDGDVYVSVIPFVKDVNVGASNWNADWIYWGTSPLSNNVNNPTAPMQDLTETDNTSWDAINGTCSNAGRTPRSTCKTGYCSVAGYTTQATCEAAGGKCSIAGYTSSATCKAAGTCSIAGNTTQASCTAAYQCSIAGYTTQASCTAAGVCSIAGNTTKASCQSAGVCKKQVISGDGWVTITLPDNSQGQCQGDGGTWTKGTWTTGSWKQGTWTWGVWTGATWTPPGVWTPKSHKTAWNGCVMDRGYPTSPSKLTGKSGPDTTYNYDTNVGAPDPLLPRWSSLYPAEQYGSCPQAVMPLSYDWSSMNTLVDNMVANGSTNQNIGLQLGWLSLVGGGPFPAPPPMDTATYKYTQAIILLTDGLNTQDRWYGNGSAVDTRIDARQQMTCDNFKAASAPKIQNIIYTIQVNTDGDPTSTLLQNCASASDKFYLLTSADQILMAFNEIANSLSQLRIAQ